MSPRPLLDAALQYAGRGWRVIPLHGITTVGGAACCTCRKGPDCPTPGKHPRIKTGRDHAHASADRAQVERWWGRWPTANIGLTGFTVIDADGPAGVAAVRALVAQLGPLPRTLTARSGRAEGGFHLYYQPTTLRNSSGGGLDLRAAGGLVVAPPSMHASGQPYAWVVDAPIAAMPDGWQDWFDHRPRSERSQAASTATRHVAADAVVAGPRPAYLKKRPRAPLAVRTATPILDVAAAVAMVPNDATVGWDAWSRMGMTIWACTEGSDLGRLIFARWSQRCREKHDDAAVEERWTHWAQSPPIELGYGTLVHLAREIEPGWEPPSRRVRSVDPHTGNPGAETGAKSPVRQIATSDTTSDGGLFGPHPPEPAYVNGHAGGLPHTLHEATSDNPLIRLNQQYSVIGDVGGKCLVMGWVPSHADPAVQVPSFQTFKSFAERYGHQYVLTKKTNHHGEVVEEVKQLGSYWLKWTGRRSFERVEMEPGKPGILPGNVLNLWCGFAVEPAAGSWRMMQEHIAEVLAAGDAEAADYITRWAAWTIQNPGERAEVALVLRGGQGTGKGTFANALRQLFGQHGLQVFHSHHLVGNFNAHLRNCLLLFADEAFWAGDKKGESALKGMLSERMLVIEQKGVDPVQWTNRLHVIMAANAEWVVPASADARRYAVFNVGDSRQGDRKYFAALYDEMRDGGLAAMLHDLQGLDLKGWHPRQILLNEALRQQKERSLSPLQVWWLEILEAGKIPFALRDTPHKASAPSLVAHAREHVPELRNLTVTAMGRFLGTVGGERKHTQEGNFWLFGPVGETRARWEKLFGKWQWPNVHGRWA